MKKILLLILFVAASSMGMDLQDLVGKYAKKEGFNINNYVYKSGPYKGEINYAKLLKNHGSDLEKTFSKMGVKAYWKNDSTSIVETAYETKVVIGGHDAVIYHQIYGTCVVQDWWPLNETYFRKMKNVSCGENVKFESNPDGSIKRIVIDSSVEECVEHWNNPLKSCKRYIVRDISGDGDPEEVWMDSTTQREYMRKSFGMILLVTEYHSNGMPKWYKNVSDDNQYYAMDSLGNFTKMVDFVGNFRYDRYFPQKDDDPAFMITTDSVNYNPEYIYILKDDDYSVVIDSVKK